METLADQTTGRVEFVIFLKDVLGYPFNSVSATQALQERKPKTDLIKADLKEKLSRLDRYLEDVKRLNELTEKGLEPYASTDVFENISKFAVTAVSQLRERISEQAGKKLSEIEVSNSTDRTNAIKYIDMFLQNPKISVDKSSIKLTWDNGAYSGLSSYAIYGSVEQTEAKKGFINRQVKKFREDISIEYSFSLNPSEIDIFSAVLHFSSLAKGFKLPVKHAVSWISKEPVVDFEKMDRYDMSEAILSDNSLFVTFRDWDKGSEVRFTSSSFGEKQMVDIDYKDSVQSVSVTSQPVLKKNIDMKVVDEIMETIRNSVTNLESRRNGLKSLVVNNEDIFSTFNTVQFLKAIVKAGMSKYAVSPDELKSSGFRTIMNENGLTEASITDRIRVLGPTAEEISKLIMPSDSSQ